MYQVLIADDEKEIREGLAAWNWEELGVQLAGCCANGAEALLFVTEHPVDIVITDIRMPFMNGIELMEVLKRQFEFIQVLILSGYSEFDYARRAVQLGAANYLLKPIQYEEMADAMRILIAHMDEHKQMEQRMAVLKRKTEQLSRVLRNQFLLQLFEGTLSAGQMEERSAEGEVFLDGSTYHAGIIRLDRYALDNYTPTSQELNRVVLLLDSILDRNWGTYGEGYHLVNPKTAEVSLLIKGQADKEAMETLMEQLLKYKGFFMSTFTISVGPEVSAPTGVHRSLLAARIHLKQIKRNTVDILWQRPLDWDPDVPTPTTPEQTSEAIQSIVTDTGPGAIALSGAKRYIQRNYLRSLTLKEVAEQVYVSPNYLSALFKARNETFLKYLTLIRINKARELLRDPQYKVYKVAEMVGYADPSYFWEVFKKQTGQTPSEYRLSTLSGRDQGSE